MRVIVFFDLPMETTEQKRNYRKFRRHLIKSGFVMLQESVYAKFALNYSQAERVIFEIKKEKPSSGLVQILSVTEKQFSKMECATGAVSTNVMNTDEKLLIL